MFIVDVIPNDAASPAELLNVEMTLEECLGSAWDETAEDAAGRTHYLHFCMTNGEAATIAKQFNCEEVEAEIRILRGKPRLAASSS
jgi:hypothetical protein